MFEVGDEIRTISNLFVGGEIPVGTRGRITERRRDNLFQILLADGTYYYLSPDEMQKLDRFYLIQEIIFRLEEIGLPKNIIDDLEAWLEIEREKECRKSEKR